MDLSKQTNTAKRKNICKRYENITWKNKQNCILKKSLNKMFMKLENSQNWILKEESEHVTYWTLKHYRKCVEGQRRCSVFLSISRSDLRVSIVTHIVICVFSPVSLRSSPNRWVLKKAGGVLAPALNHDTCRPVGTYTSHRGLQWAPAAQKAG